MPQNGEINTKFGVYQSACCGGEIIIREGATFPNCPQHRKMPTIWQLVEADTTELKRIEKKKHSDPAA